MPQTLNDQLATALVAAKKRDHARQDQFLAKMGRIMDEWYLALVRASGSRVTIYKEVPRIHAHYSRLLGRSYVDGLDALIDTTHTEFSDAIISVLPESVAKQLLVYHKQPLTESILSSKLVKLLRHVVFPALDTAAKNLMILKAKAVDAFNRALRNVTASALLSVVVAGQSQGLAKEEIAKKYLEPMMHKAKSNVLRVSDTVASIVTNETNIRTYARLGPMLQGYEVRCIVDKASRPWHGPLRNKKRYYIKPKAGQRGLEDMPWPPFEPISRIDVPPNAPQCAFRCRCWLLPVVRVYQEVL